MEIEILKINMRENEQRLFTQCFGGEVEGNYFPFSFVTFLVSSKKIGHFPFSKPSKLFWC